MNLSQVHWWDQICSNSAGGSLPPKQDARAHHNVSLAFAKIRARGGNPDQECWVIDCGCTEKFLAFRKNECPCLLRSRSGDQSYWCSSLGRYLTTEDRMSLQGFECGPERPGDSSMNQMLGNAMSVNVVQAVLLQAAWALGLF